MHHGLEDIEMYAPGGVHLMGKVAVGEAIKQSLNAYKDAKITAVAMYVDGDTVITEVEETATQSGELRLATGELVPPSGRGYRSRGVSIDKVRDGVIVRTTTYYDRYGFL